MKQARMKQTGITMAVLVLMFIGGTYWGFQLLTADVGSSAEAAPACEDRTIMTGEKLTPNLIQVNVYNAGKRAGLAHRLQINLQRRGFLAGDIGNSPEKVDVSTVTILTKNKSAGKVHLVAKQFTGDVAYKTPSSARGAGVSVVIGDEFAGLAEKAPRSVKASEDLTVCVPLDPAGDLEKKKKEGKK